MGEMADFADEIDDLDDLENDLFGVSTKQNNPLTEEKPQVKTREIQKNVAFEDPEDSLLDDLSDDLDLKNPELNLSDSRATKRAELFKTNLFSESNISGQHAEKEPAVSKPLPLEKLPINEPPKSLDTFEIPRTESAPSKVQNQAKKSSLMEEMFGSRPRASSLKNISNGPKNPPTKSVETGEIFSESMPDLLGREKSGRSNPSGFSLTSSNAREPRRGRRRSPALEDPLGFLTLANAQEPQHSGKKSELAEQAKQTELQDLPDWLDGAKKEKLEMKGTTPTAAQDLQKNSGVHFEKRLDHPEISQLTEVQFEQQAALITLQQQEHELRAATVLSQQSEHLHNIISRQKSQLNEQERMFNILVKKQVDKQSALDMEIKMQQAKIDHYIQVLAKDPVDHSASFPDHEDFTYPKEEKLENSKTESNTLTKLEMEKETLENIVESLKDKHEKEIKILEESHETQMHFMRSSMDRLETKLREDTETLEKYYEKKIETLISDMNKLEEFFKGQIQSLKDEHKTVISEMHTRHKEQTALLQKEHSETIENISRAKQLERQAIDFMESNKNSLETILRNSQEIFHSFEHISQHLKTKEAEWNTKSEKDIIKQEQQLKVLSEQLNSQQELLEIERKELMIAAHNLKSETSQLSLQFQKNTELYNETETRLRLREQALVKERELFQEQTSWERNHLQYLKDAWMTEQKRQMQQLAAEREAAAAEKAKLEVLSYLKTNSDDVTKAELEAAIKAAHDAVNSANAERKKWQERLLSYEAEQEKIRIKEKQLTERAKDLEDLTQSAILKREEGVRALAEAQRMEKQHNERMSQLESQLELLAQRENKIATEKLSLARERLAVKIHQDKLEKNITDDSFHNQTHQPSYVSQVKTHFRDVVDPKLLLLKLNLDNKLDTSNQLISDMQTLG